MQVKKTIKLINIQKACMKLIEKIPAKELYKSKGQVTKKERM